VSANSRFQNPNKLTFFALKKKLLLNIYKYISTYLIERGREGICPSNGLLKVGIITLIAPRFAANDRLGVDKKMPLNLNNKQVQELATSYACMVLADCEAKVNDENINKLLGAAGVKVEPFYPKLFSQLLAGKDLVEMFAKAGGSGGGAGGATAGEGGEGEEKKEEKKEEEEDDGGFDFDDDE